MGENESLIRDLCDALKTLISRHGYEDDNVTPKDWSEWVVAREAVAAAEAALSIEG